ncbi:hypothetical protein OC861_006117 [Tilletia horrida]|nr:hypothetical protein OC861_006117 [Tilletia horrida]
MEDFRIVKVKRARLPATEDFRILKVIRVPVIASETSTLRHGRFSCKMLDGRGRPRKLYGTKKDGRTVECYNPDNGIRDAEEVARLGSIRMSVQRLVDVREELTPEEPSEDEDDDDEDAEELLPSHIIYEKAQKVGAIGFAAGPKRTRKMEAKYHLCGTPDPAFEQIDFIFHCMTRVGLQVKNLIPGKRRQKGGQSQYSTRMPPDMQKIKKEHGERKRRRREREARDHERDDTDAEKAALKRKLQKLKERNAELQRQEGSSSRAKVEPVAFDFTQGGTAHEPILVE